MHRHVIALSAAVVFCSTSLGFATLRVYDFSMDGLQEAPTPVVTNGTGLCNVTLDDVSGAVSVNCTFQNLTGTSTVAHIHGPAAAGAAASPILDLLPTVGVMSGTITGNGILSPANITNVINGLTYINLHSSFRPGGEIRGQIVPEPTTLGLVGIAAAACLLRRPRR